MSVKKAAIQAAEAPGFWSGVGTLALPAGLTTLKALPGKYERYLQEKYKEGVPSPELTAEDRAAASAAAESGERAARALSARGSATGGRSGLDLERARLARKQALNALASELSGRRGAKALKYGADVKSQAMLGGYLGKMAAERRRGIFEDLVGAGKDPGWLGDPAVQEGFRQIGLGGRKKKAQTGPSKFPQIFKKKNEG